VRPHLPFSKPYLFFRALSSDFTTVSPVCETWEDLTWCVFRCWLEVAVDTRLASDAAAAAALSSDRMGDEAEEAMQGHDGGYDYTPVHATATPALLWPPGDLRRGAPGSLRQALDRVSYIFCLFHFFLFCSK
jgi:hypothetical protein